MTGGLVRPTLSGTTALLGNDCSEDSAGGLLAADLMEEAAAQEVVDTLVKADLI